MSATAVGLFEINDTVDPARLLASVSDYERGHYHALNRNARSPRRARQYLASRWLLRVHVASRYDLQPLDVQLRDCPGGPPTVACPDIRIGLSHSHGTCMCITSTRPRVGCDIEHHQANRPVHAIAAQYFHPQEAAYLKAMPDDAARSAFYRLWTLKEAAQKARGLGMAGGMRSPAFVMEPTLRCLDAPPQGPWTFASSALDVPGKRYSLALAIAGAPLPAPFVVREYGVEQAPDTRDHASNWHIAAMDH